MNKPRTPRELKSFEPLSACIRSLATRGARDASRNLWIEGARSFIAACDAGLEFEAVVCSPILLRCSVAEMLARRLAARGIRRWKLSPEQFRQVSMASRASGIGAIVRQRWTRLDDVPRRSGLGWLVIESIRSPGNLGTILRTAEAVGIGGVIFLGPRPDPFDPAVVRACMGGIFSLPLVRTSAEAVARWAELRQVTLVGLAPQAPRLWTELPTETEVGLVLGDERNGLSVEAQRLCGTLVRLPMTGRADSLNVGVAAGVAMYELVRRSLAAPA
ncbi:MAG TPA: RNA methyltransferase [Pirellulales bacterium]|nr:RNA methyltransferase [Pirellulales bacterium]